MGAGTTRRPTPTSTGPRAHSGGFYSNYGECFAGNVRVESPADLEAYDPTLYQLLGRVFATHHIPMDIYHGKRIRPRGRGPLSCGP